VHAQGVRVAGRAREEAYAAEGDTWEYGSSAVHSAGGFRPPKSSMQDNVCSESVPN
jgi:hypothetical protein